MTEVERIVVRIEIAARPATVFRFFTDPDRFGQWMGAAQGEASIEPRAGGEVRVNFPDFGRTVLGEVVDLETPRRFAFTWGYEGDEDLPPGSSTVEIELADAPDGTILTLTHSGLPTDELRRAHRAGFRLYVSVLAAAAARAEHGDRLDAIVEAWFDAWNEDDPDRRRRALERCLAEDGEFRDDFAALRGRESLAGHIAASRAFTPGMRLEPAASPDLNHRYVRFGWRALGEQGPVAEGVNFAILAGDGRFRAVAGFRDASPR